MKKLLLLLFVANFLFVSAQTTTKKTYYKKSTAATAAASDSATIYYNLGWDYYKLDSMGPARYYWEKASYAKGKWESKNAALYRLGLMQQNGEGVDTNLNMAMEYYKRASGTVNRLGDADAIKTIGGMYENGYGVQQNFDKALEWYLKAKRAGNMYVDEDIARMKDRLKKK